MGGPCEGRRLQDGRARGRGHGERQGQPRRAQRPAVLPHGAGGQVSHRRPCPGGGHQRLPGAKAQGRGSCRSGDAGQLPGHGGAGAAARAVRCADLPAGWKFGGLREAVADGSSQAERGMTPPLGMTLRLRATPYRRCPRRRMLRQRRAERTSEEHMATRTENQPKGKDTTRQLLDGLNEDLRGEFQAVIMYRLYASMVQGPWRQDLRAFFSTEIPEELGHAQILADKISALGGTPASEPAPVKVVKEAKAMLETALAAEIETIDRYVRRREQAEAAGEPGFVVVLDDIIADETNHRDEIRQILARWP